MSAAVRTVLHHLGLLLHIPGLMALASMPVAWAVGEPFAIGPLFWTALVSLGVGQSMRLGFRPEEELSLYRSMIIAAVGWLAVPLLSALPMLLLATHLPESAAYGDTAAVFGRPLNAAFEAFSGFTSTGLTMATHPSQLPHSLQWWRSLMQWVGGVGVVVLMLSILKPSVSSWHLYESEARTQKILPSVVATVRAIWWIYVLLTAVSVLGLRLAGVSWWESINHAMCGIATGGFSVTDASLASYGTGAKLVMVVVMIVGATSFFLLYQVVQEGRLSGLVRDQQHRVLWLFLILGSCWVLLENRFFQTDAAWVDGVFQWTSALCTAGYQTADVGSWSPTVRLLLSLGMLLGGAAGSTAGGLKQERLVHLLASVRCRFQILTGSPHQVRHFDVAGARVSESELNRIGVGAGVFSLLWLGVTGLGIFVLVHLVPGSHDLSEILFEVASAQGNVGLSTGIVGPDLPWAAKSAFMMLMWVGRLEIFPVMLLVVALVRRLPGAS